MLQGKPGNYFLIDQGLKTGDRIVYGVETISDGAVIQPVTHVAGQPAESETYAIIAVRPKN